MENDHDPPTIEYFGPTQVAYGSIKMGYGEGGPINRQVDLRVPLLSGPVSVTATLSCSNSSGGVVFGIYNTHVAKIDDEHTQVLISATYLRPVADPNLAPKNDVWCNYVVMGVPAVDLRKKHATSALHGVQDG